VVWTFFIGSDIIYQSVNPEVGTILIHLVIFALISLFFFFRSFVPVVVARDSVFTTM